MTDPALDAWKFARESEGYRVMKVAAMHPDSLPARFEAIHDTLPRVAFIATGDHRSHERLMLA